MNEISIENLFLKKNPDLANVGKLFYFNRSFGLKNNNNLKRRGRKRGRQRRAIVLFLNLIIYIFFFFTDFEGKKKVNFRSVLSKNF